MGQGVQPVVSAPQVELPPAHVAAQLAVVEATMSVQEKKMLGQFFRLAPPRFSEATSKDDHEFLITCLKWNFRGNAK
ncbi:hypothetical protein KY289_035807 [Solanum tuberosum]|nr:hypothetical protein KY289_035807 [Solanum tuberosum]